MAVFKKIIKTIQLPKNLKKVLSSKKLTVGFLAILLILWLVMMVNIVFFADRIYPGIYVASINITGLTNKQAVQKINTVISRRADKILSFTYGPSGIERFDIDLSKKDISTNTQDVVLEAQNFGHKKFFIPPKKLDLQIKLGGSLDSDIDLIAKAVDQPPISAVLTVDDNTIVVTSSQDGFVLDRDKLKKSLGLYLNGSELTDFGLPIKKIGPKLSYENALRIKNRLEKIRQTPIQLKFKNQTFTLDLPTTLSLVDLENSEGSLAEGQFFGQKINLISVTLGNEEFTDSKLSLNHQQLKSYFQDIADQIDRDVREPLFAFEQGRVTEFQPPLDGYQLNIDKASLYLEGVLTDTGGDKKVINLPVDIIKPKNKLVNDLGIKELLGRGVSNFVGSIPNRIFNISLTASKLNGVLIPPGETFSFNQTVGDISAATGYKQAYVIKSGRTVLDDGGGVCQDSTTLFRAVLYAGLPVVERTAHAYRVGYYEQGFPPGLDATVFSPSVDFKFKNDTPTHILIQAYTAGKTLYVDLYGTSDGRLSTISTPVVTNKTPPPPELRQDDPNLPKGEVKQVDWAAAGANVVFTRVVTRNGETIISETYRSNYRPWQAVFLVGTKE